jgi:hypothetical protein
MTDEPMDCLDALIAQLPAAVARELRRKRDAAQDADDPTSYLRDYADAYTTPDVDDPVVRCAGVALAAAVAADDNERGKLEVQAYGLAAQVVAAGGGDPGEATYTITTADGSSYSITGLDAMRLLDPPPP